MIRNVQNFWKGLQKKKYSLVCRRFNITLATAKKYVLMTEEEINELDKPNDYKVRDRSGNEFVNIIYKMLADGYDDETIFYYLVEKGITASYSTISGYIAAIALENFYADSFKKFTDIQIQRRTTGNTPYKFSDKFFVIIFEHKAF